MPIRTPKPERPPAPRSASPARPPAATPPSPTAAAGADGDAVLASLQAAELSLAVAAAALRARGAAPPPAVAAAAARLRRAVDAVAPGAAAPPAQTPGGALVPRLPGQLSAPAVSKGKARWKGLQSSLDLGPHGTPGAATSSTGSPLPPLADGDRPRFGSLVQDLGYAPPSKKSRRQRKMKATNKIISLLRESQREEEKDASGDGGETPPARRKSRGSILYSRTKTIFAATAAMARETWGRSLFARRAPGAVRGPFPWYLGCGNVVYRWYWTLEAVPENAVNEHGIMDHNNLKGEDGDDVGFEKTRDALVLLLHLPGVMRQRQWPQLLLLPNSWVVQYWSLFILILVVVQSVVVPVEATFDDVTVFKGALEWASTAAFGCDLFFQFLFATTDDHEKIIVDGCVEINRWFGGSPPNFGTLLLGHIEVDVADFWTNRWLSSSSRSPAEESGAVRSITLTLKSV